MLVDVIEGRHLVGTPAHHPHRFERSIPFRVFMFFFIAVYSGLGLVSVAVGLRNMAVPSQQTTRGDWVGLTLGGLTFIAIAVTCWRFGRMAVLVEEAGVTLIPFGRTRRWTWEQIGNVEMTLAYDDDTGMRYCPQLVLTSGERVKLRPACSSNLKAPSSAVRTTNAIRLGLLRFR